MKSPLSTYLDNINLLFLQFYLETVGYFADSIYLSASRWLFLLNIMAGYFVAPSSIYSVLIFCKSKVCFPGIPSSTILLSALFDLPYKLYVLLGSITSSSFTTFAGATSTSNPIINFGSLYSSI